MVNVATNVCYTRHKKPPIPTIRNTMEIQRRISNLDAINIRNLSDTFLILMIRYYPNTFRLQNKMRLIAI